MRKRDRARRRGVAMVEFAIGTFLFLVALFGVMDWAWVFFQHQTLLWRAADAARLASATRVDEQAQVINIVRCGSTDCSGALFGFVLAAKVEVRHIQSHDQVDDITNVPAYYAQVRVYDYQIQHFTPLLGSTFTGREIIAAQPMECLNAVGNCWVD
jgi:Flp pilus assembly protein TadG